MDTKVEQMVEDTNQKMIEKHHAVRYSKFIVEEHLKLGS